MPELLVVFEGIHQTLSAEGFLKARGVEVNLVPTPPAVSLGCGFSILAAGGADALPAWWFALESRRAAYRVVLKEGHKSYEEIDRCEGACLPPAGDPEQKDDGGRGSQ